MLTFAALSLVPKRRSWTTRFGGRTFYCYLLHGYVIVIPEPTSSSSSTGSRSSASGPSSVCIVGSTILANLLMTVIFSKVFRPLFEPKLGWLFREMPQPEAAPSKPEPKPEDAKAESTSHSRSGRTKAPTVTAGAFVCSSCDLLERREVEVVELDRCGLR